MLLAGFILGLGAVTVIDLHGFLARKSLYWTEATIRTHKVTKPLIWVGIFLSLAGAALFYWGNVYSVIIPIQFFISVLLIMNGCFLSFYVSPYLLHKEKHEKNLTLLPDALQYKIIASFIVSFLGWWGNVLLLTYYITAVFTN
jgi:hypothetical protein